MQENFQVRTHFKIIYLFFYVLQEYVSTLSSIKEQMLYDLVRLVFSRDTTASNVSTIIDQLYAGLMVSVIATSQAFMTECMICV